MMYIALTGIGILIFAVLMVGLGYGLGKFFDKVIPDQRAADRESLKAECEIDEKK